MEAALDKRLRELDVGARQGMTWEQFRIAFPDFFPDPFGTAADRSVGSRVPGAESAEEVSRRMVAVLSDAATALRPGETGVLVGHGASLRTGLLAFFDVPQELSEMLAGMANCAWSVLEQHGERGWQIIDYNAQTLPQPLELADDLASP
jgi:probable phosphoglycerate mutase